MNKLIFIDTNIFLDFYRFRNSDISLKYLDLIDKNHDKIICTSQVEMEFKKHRAEEIRKTHDAITPPNWQSLSIPAILSESSSAKVIIKHKKEIERQHKSLRQKVIKLLETPQLNDKVFQVLQRLFKDSTKINLQSSNSEKYRIRKLALKRFVLGYPPRKKDDTSIGDSINWEWIIDCAIKTKSDIIIVTRDSDFGQFIQDQSFINDWLLLEFKERVSKTRKITLTNKLSFAFKEAISKRSVTKQMESEEQKVILANQLETKSIEEIRHLSIDERLANLKETIQKYRSQIQKD